MAALSSNEARTTCLFNTFRSSCQFVVMLIDDLISCDEDIPDYIFSASNELLTKVLCLTNSIYKISGTLKEETKKKIDDPYNQCKGKNKGPVEYKSMDEQSKTASQVSSESNNTNSNTETSPFISFVKAATQKMNTYPAPENKKPSSVSQKDTHPKQTVLPSSSVQKKAADKIVPAAKTSAGSATQNDALPQKKIEDAPLKKGFSITHNYNVFMKTIINPSGAPTYYCQLCDCVVSSRKWPTHVEVGQHKKHVKEYPTGMLVQCTHCELNMFVERDTVSKYFIAHQQNIHPGKGKQIFDGDNKAVTSAKTSGAAAQNGALKKGSNVDAPLQKGYSITNQFYIFIKRLQLQSDEPIYYCQLCDCMILIKKWITHFEVANHKKFVNQYPTGILVQCSHCQFNLFAERDTVSKYFSFHSEMMHRDEKGVQIMYVPANAVPSSQPKQKPVSNAKEKKLVLSQNVSNSPVSKKQSAEAVSSVKNGSSRQRGAPDLDEEHPGVYPESPFRYIIRLAKEYFDTHQMKAKVYFCIPCQSVCDSTYLWVQHIRMPEHIAVCDSSSFEETACLHCGLSILGPEEALSEYFQNPLHLQLDSLFN